MNNQKNSNSQNRSSIPKVQDTPQYINVTVGNAGDNLETDSVEYDEINESMLNRRCLKLPPGTNYFDLTANNAYALSKLQNSD